MKYVLLIALIVSLSGMAEHRELAEVFSSTNPKTSEPVQCFPQKQVDGWKKRKKAKPKEVVVTKEVIKEVVKEVEAPALKNRVKVFAGFSPGFTRATRVGNVVTLEDKLGPVPGIGYERQLSKRWSVEGIWLFNKSYLLGVGYSF